MIKVAVVELIALYLSYRVGGWLALFAAAALGAFASGFLALKHAVLRVAIHALGKMRLGDRVLSMVFAYDGFVALGLERIPLARAEEILTSAIGAAREKLGGDGFILRRVNARVLDMVATTTLSAFRADGADGVDLVLVRKALSEKLDNTLVGQLEGALTRITFAVLLANVAVDLTLAYVIARLS
jgi:hypothetical protein